MIWLATAVFFCLGAWKLFDAVLTKRERRFGREGFKMPKMPEDPVQAPPAQTIWGAFSSPTQQQEQLLQEQLAKQQLQQQLDYAHRGGWASRKLGAILGAAADQPRSMKRMIGLR